MLFGGAGATLVRAADALYGASLGADRTGHGLMFCKNPPPASPFTHDPPGRTLFVSVRKVPGIWSWAGAGLQICDKGDAAIAAANL